MSHGENKLTPRDSTQHAFVVVSSSSYYPHLLKSH
jgi:hypothetical protein